ncbi:glucose-1-phosphate cytidylyltransferase [Candidatus Woesearchaeota archaeon]|nr:glucose-1-phosphate cytidylyltransferase [Candidatus Woesearchaeota archaeon]
MDKEKVVILCGGMGTRLKEETVYKPKPLVKVGSLPILWHIMKIYSHFGHNDFILCLGYKGEMIKEFFTNFEDFTRDFTINPKTGKKIHHGRNEMPDWNITLVDTGLDSNTGKRVKKIEKHIDGDNFMVTYGDGVANIDIQKLIDFHKSHQKIATVTSILPPPRWSFLKIDNQNKVQGFNKTDKLPNAWIDGGFFVFKKNIFDYLPENQNLMLEKEPMQKLAEEENLLTYQHQDFWQCMDTYRDMEVLNEMWNKGNAPWKIW